MSKRVTEEEYLQYRIERDQREKQWLAEYQICHARTLRQMEEKDRRIKQRKLDEQQKRKLVGQKGYIYLVQKEGTNLYKIGKTVDPYGRIRKFQILLPFPIEAIHLIESDNYDLAETHLHQKYADCRKGGEWFELAPEQIEEIKAIKRM